jgi:hypothetical protein
MGLAADPLLADVSRGIRARRREALQSYPER